MYTSNVIALLRAEKPGLRLTGIDTTVGEQVTTPLHYATSIVGSPQSGVIYDAASNRVLVSKDGAVLSGYDFKGVTLYITGKNVTISNCTFEAGAKEAYCVQSMSSGTIVQNCTFTGGSDGNELPLGAFVTGANITIQDDKFLNAPGDAVGIRSGVVKDCYFSGAGYSSTGEHPDAIWVTNTNGPVTITGNFIDWTDTTVNGNVHAGNNAVRITTELGPVSNVTVTNNVLLGGTYTIQPGSVGGSMSNVSITNNVIGFGHYGAFYYDSLPGVTIANNTVQDYTSPIYSTAAWSDYAATGLAGSTLLTANGGPSLSAPSSGRSTLYGAGQQSLAMFGSATGETVFVGGAGSQYEIAGKGANIFKYLAFADSTVFKADGIVGFDAAKDVIDLGAINANPAAAGQAFSFIGGAAFTSAGAQVRVTQDVAQNMTYVEATMAGDSAADLSIRLSGLINLTAANFALNKTQSDAAAANGAALNVTRSAATNGASLYDYTHVLGHSYGSYESIYDKTNALAAQAFNLAGGAGSVDLMGSGLIYSDGAAGESVKTGTATFSIGAHASETLTLDGSSETLQFHAGFGSASVSGFGPGDNLQLDTSMFSYLNPGMSQDQSLAALLSHATSGASGLRIADTRGDSLTLLGVTSAQLASHAGTVSFA